MEENVYSGGIGQEILSWLKKEGSDIRTLNIALPDKFIEQGKREFLLEKYGLDAESIYDNIINVMKK